jgi:hypothetical protein
MVVWKWDKDFPEIRGFNEQFHTFNVKLKQNII